MDGHYLTIGPVAGAAYAQHSWNSFVGAELSWVRLRERRMPAAWGVSLGAVSWGSRSGGKLWGELEVAFRRPFSRVGLPGLGLALGPTVEVDDVLAPRWGAQGTLWIFAGIIPYVRVGAVAGEGAFFETGVMIKIPVKIRY